MESLGKEIIRLLVAVNDVPPYIADYKGCLRSVRIYEFHQSGIESISLLDSHCRFVESAGPSSVTPCVPMAL